MSASRRTDPLDRVVPLKCPGRLVFFDQGALLVHAAFWFAEERKVALIAERDDGKLIRKH